MSVAFCWKLVSHDHRRFATGTSNDIEPLDSLFGGIVRYVDLPRLRAMQAITRKESLWQEIADKLESLGEGAEINVWPEY